MQINYKHSVAHLTDEDILKQMARFAKALGHPVRLQILQYLATENICYTGDLVELLPLAQSTVSQHLKELKDAGLIQGKICLPKVRYCINKENWQKARQLFDDFFSNYIHENVSINIKKQPVKILILCTGNSCRSQMAEGFLRSFDPDLEVVSAGTEPGKEVHPKAVQVMREVGIDISDAKPKPVTDFTDKSFDYVITVCDEARETCPVFTGKVKHRLHIGFEDPARVEGMEEFILSEFRRIRDEIKRKFKKFYDGLTKDSNRV